MVLLGLCFGSFINALVWRVYMQSKTGSKAKQGKYSITKGRSMCVDCGHTLNTLDLIPVFGWVYLKGKCRYCHKKISLQYPVVEIITAILFLTSYIFWPYEFSNYGILIFVVWLALLVGMVALVIYDFRWMILPNKIVFKLYGLATIFVVLILVKNFSLENLLNILLSVAIGGGLFYLLFQVSKGKWIGGGDVKLGFVLGALCLKPGNAFLMLFLASLMGVLYIVPGMAIGKVKRTTRIPFGPFLIAGTIVVVLFGEQIIEWYLSKVLMLY